MDGLHTLPSLTICATLWCRISGNERGGRKKYSQHIKADKVPTRRSERLQSKDIPNMADSPTQEDDNTAKWDDEEYTPEGTEDDIPEPYPMENVRL